MTRGTVLVLLCVAVVMSIAGGPLLSQEKDYDAPPELRDTGRHLRDLFKQEKFADIHALCERGYAQATDDEARAFFLHQAADAYVAQGDRRGLDLLYQVLHWFPATMQAPLVTLDLADLDLEQAEKAKDPDTRRQLALRALATLDQFLATYPGHERVPRTLWKRGICCKLLEDWEAMLADYQYVAEVYPASAWAHVCLEWVVALEQSAGAHDQAILDARRYLGLFPHKHPETVQFLLGVSVARKGLIEEAALEFNKALAYYAADDAGRAETLYRIAAEWLAVQEYDYAHAYLAAVLANPAQAFDAWRDDAQYLNALAYKLARDYDAALAAFSALAASPEAASYRETAQRMIAEIEATRAGR